MHVLNLPDLSPAHEFHVPPLASIYSMDAHEGLLGVGTRDGRIHTWAWTAPGLQRTYIKVVFPGAGNGTTSALGNQPPPNGIRVSLSHKRLKG